MPEKKKILVFTSKTGGGHISLSDALQDLLSAHCQVETIDPQPSTIHWHYRTVSRHALWLWALEFRLVDTPRRSRWAHAVASRLLYPYVAAALRSYQPDAVLSTYPFLTSEVTYAMRRMGWVRPFGMLFADPNGVHHSWLSESRADLALAPTQETYDQAHGQGFKPGQLYLSGWPVRAQFHNAELRTQVHSTELRTQFHSDDLRTQFHSTELRTQFSSRALPGRAEVLAGLGLEAERFTVFLQGGGEGAARFAATVENVLGIPELQVILAAGTNQALVQQFQNRPRLAVLGFTREIAQYMAAADVVMGKAGPNVLMEAVALGRPFIATAFIPGQEFANLSFIQRHRLGWVALKPEEQSQLLSGLSQAAPELEEMCASVAAYRQWNFERVVQIPGLVMGMVAARHGF